MDSCRDGQLVLAGDFNFTDNFAQDRLQRADAVLYHPDVLTSECMRAQCPGLVCAFRARHPKRRAFTYLANGSASRIDRIYVPTAILTHVEQCVPVVETLSDHRPVVMRLRAAAPDKAGVGPGLRRTRMYFAQYPALKLEFHNWLSMQCELAPAGGAALAPAGGAPAGMVGTVQGFRVQASC